MDATVERLNTKEGSMVGLRLDVTDEASVRAFGDAIAERLGDGVGLDGVVNNAGILVTPGPTEWTPLSAFRRMYDVNVLGTVAVTQAVLPLVRRAQGRIVNVASIAGRFGLPSQPAYCASKYAVEAVSDILRREMVAWGVTVHIIEPGVFPNTGLYDTFRADLDTLWAGLTPELREDYGQAYFESFRKQIDTALMEMGTSDSSLVPKAMVHALTSDSPQYRYRVGPDSKYLITLLTHLHESTQDKLITMDVPGRPKKVPPAAAPPGARAAAMARMPSGWGRWALLATAIASLYARGHLRLRSRA